MPASQSVSLVSGVEVFFLHLFKMGSIIAKSYHGQGGGGCSRIRGVHSRRQMSEDLISPKILGVEDLMAELVLEHPEWKSRGENERGIDTC